MTQLETLLQNNREVQQFALAVLAECDGMRQFAARCVEAMINSAISAQADEMCGGEAPPYHIFADRMFGCVYE